MVPLWLRARCRECSNTVNYNTKWTSPSKTHNEIDILMDMLQKNIRFTIETQPPLFQSLLAPSCQPRRWLSSRLHGVCRFISCGFYPTQPEIVFGHNLQHVAPFGATTSGFCMVFQYATLIFSTPDPIFGAPGQGLGPGRPGAPFWGQ